MKTIASKISATLIAVAVLLGGSVVAAPAASAAPPAAKSCSQLITQYAMAATYEELNRNVNACAPNWLTNLTPHGKNWHKAVDKLSSNWTKATQLVGKKKFAEAKNIAARDFAAILASAPKQARQGMLAAAEDRIKGISNSNVTHARNQIGHLYTLLLNFSVYQGQWNTVGDVAALLADSTDKLKLSKHWKKSLKVVNRYMVVLEKATSYVKGSANRDNYTRLQYFVNVPLPTTR